MFINEGADGNNRFTRRLLSLDKLPFVSLKHLNHSQYECVCKLEFSRNVANLCSNDYDKTKLNSWIRTNKVGKTWSAGTLGRPAANSRTLLENLEIIPHNLENFNCVGNILEINKLADWVGHWRAVRGELCRTPD